METKHHRGKFQNKIYFYGEKIIPVKWIFSSIKISELIFKNFHENNEKHE